MNIHALSRKKNRVSRYSLRTPNANFLMQQHYKLVKGMTKFFPELTYWLAAKVKLVPDKESKKKMNTSQFWWRCYKKTAVVYEKQIFRFQFK